MKISILIFIFLSSGCANLNPKTRHQHWLIEMERQVGKSVFNCEGNGRCLRYRGDSLFQGDSILSNGNKEAAYYMPYRKYPKCRFFFEYENKSGIIIRYRYEESEPFACAVVL